LTFSCSVFVSAANPITNAVAHTGRTVDDIGKLFAKQVW